jgi:hypothetical protein
MATDALATLCKVYTPRVGDQMCGPLTHAECLHRATCIGQQRDSVYLDTLAPWPSLLRCIDALMHHTTGAHRARPCLWRPPCPTTTAPAQHRSRAAGVLRSVGCCLGMLQLFAKLHFTPSVRMSKSLRSSACHLTAVHVCGVFASRMHPLDKLNKCSSTHWCFCEPNASVG